MCGADHFGHFDGGHGDYNYDHHVNCDDHHTITSMIRDLKRPVCGADLRRKPAKLGLARSL